jgi:hypothetical protein
LDLQVVVSSLSHTIETFMPTFTEELRDLPMPANEENLKPMHIEDIVFR